MINNAKNGYSKNIKFFGKLVYYSWSDNSNISLLGKKLDKDILIKNNIIDKCNISSVQYLLTDWELYENGWFIRTYRNPHLFYYKCDIGTNSYPPALNYLK